MHSAYARESTGPIVNAPRGQLTAGVGEVRAGEAEAAEAVADFGAAHQEAPEQAGAGVLDHHHDRALVDREMRGGVPVGGLAEGVDEAVVAPDAVAEPW